MAFAAEFNYFQVFFKTKRAGLVLAFFVLASPQGILASDEKTTAEWASSSEWQALLHYYKPLGRSPRSAIDDKRFFLSQNGQTNAQAELGATLDEFRKNPAIQCRFLARREFLLKKFPDLKRIECPEQEKWVSRLDAEAVSLIFAAHDLNQPASMFGHTFLKLHIRGNDQDKDLLNYGVNFAARTDKDGGALYALKGLFGLYPGFFSLAPYHQMLFDYTNLEGRDIYEYRLDLSPIEVTQLVYHLLEIDGINSDYFFLDENCSYHLLFLLQVARPSLRLVEQFPLQTIPQDTLKSLLREKGLIEATNYRESLAEKFRQRLHITSAKGERRAFELTQQISSIKQSDDLKVDFTEESPETLDLLIDHQALSAYKKDEDPVKKSVEFNLLKARARFGVPPNPADKKSAPLIEQSHDSSRLSLLALSEDLKIRYGLGIKWAYHDLLDAPYGMMPSSQINFFNLRLAQGERSTRVEFEPLSIISTLPYSQWIPKWSWFFDSLYSDFLQTGYRHIKGGFGFTTELPKSSITLFGTLGYSSPDAKFLPGAKILFLAHMTDDFRILASTERSWQTNGKHSLTPLTTLGVAYDVYYNLQLRWQRRILNENQHSELSLNSYF